MSATSRPENTAVGPATAVKQLTNDPYAFSFVQAMRVLERVRRYEPSASGAGYQLQQSVPVAGFSPPLREVVRLSGDYSLEFPQSEIASVKKSGSQWQLQVSHFGLTGAMGVLPYHYTETILQRMRQKDFSLADFLDLFNHRLISLFYQASVKYRLPLEYERRRLFRDKNTPLDMQTQCLRSLIGLGTDHLSDRNSVKDEALIFYGGLFSAQVRTASSLKQILEHQFDIPISIQEFVGQWQELIPDIRTRLASRTAPKGQNASLGRNVILGSKGWFSQGKINIHLGPLNYQQFQRFAPGTHALKALNDLVRLYLGVEHDYSFIIQVQSKNFPRQMAFDSKTKPVMGWNSWLSGGKGVNSEPTKNLNIRVSANRLK